MFKPVEPNPKFPEIEEKIIKFWKENKIFEKSIESRPKEKKWNFLDGPPFITGLPHYGTLLASIPKDLFPRFWTMQGYRVRRVWGWDVHGLPAENKVENKLGLKRKKDIEEKIGVKKFIEECRKYVSESSVEWEWYVDHIGRWVDFKNAYKTMDLTYMETVMWVFKQLYDKELIYKGLRVSLYCPHCSTPISNFEVAMDADNYRMGTDESATYKYKLKDEENTFLLAWSTTPWNKLATPALAVNPKLPYVKVKQGDEHYILAKSTLHMLKKEPKYQIVSEFDGKELIGKVFEPHYDFYKVESGKKAFIVVSGDFVTAEEGTGIVTIAAYGEEDLAVMKRDNIQIVLHVDDEGKLKPEVPNGWAGLYYLKVNKLVNEDLGKRGLLYDQKNMEHRVPTCWRCHTRLYYAPQDAWYINVQKLKPEMKDTNELVNWFPDHFKYGRFLKSMEHAPDWCISRSRYWGSPVPVWECTCGERFVPGSIKELEEKVGKKIPDLHKPEIDEVTVKCEKCGKTASRVSEVLDSWIEAGSAPYAEHHYPFNKNVKLEDFFPPDFIVEYTGQIRAWFYVLHVISTALFKSNAFKNVVVTGVILGTDGRKMSKNYGNYPDPKDLLQKYGGDALRLYLMSTPVMKGEDIIISEEQYRLQVRGLLLILWNVYNFFVTYANANNWEPNKKSFFKPKFTLDRWIISRMNGNITNMLKKGYQKYDTPEIVGQATIFINDLSTWYLRNSRERMSITNENINDKNDALQTMWTVLTTYSKALAPLVPFITEKIYKNLTDEESIHLTNWPEVGQEDSNLEKEMEHVRRVVEIAHAQRKIEMIKVRQPLSSLSSVTPEPLSQESKDIISREVNVEEITNTIGNEVAAKLNTKITPELKEKGKVRDIIRTVQQERKKLGLKPGDIISLTLPDYPARFEELIKKKVMAREIKKGPALHITQD